MKTIIETMILSGTRYDLVYHTYDDGTRVLARYVPHEGYNVYEVSATYSNTRRPTGYYVIAKGSGEAKTLFSRVVPWLKVTCCEVLHHGYVDAVLSHPEKYIVI